MQRLKLSVQSIGGKVHGRHLSLIADYMTHSGKVLALTATGMKLWNKEMGISAPFTEGAFAVCIFVQFIFHSFFHFALFRSFQFLFHFAACMGDFFLFTWIQLIKFPCRTQNVPFLMQQGIGKLRNYMGCYLQLFGGKVMVWEKMIFLTSCGAM